MLQSLLQLNGIHFPRGPILNGQFFELLPAFQFILKIKTDLSRTQDQYESGVVLSAHHFVYEMMKIAPHMRLILLLPVHSPAK